MTQLTRKKLKTCIYTRLYPQTFHWMTFDAFHWSSLILSQKQVNPTYRYKQQNVISFHTLLDISMELHRELRNVADDLRNIRQRLINIYRQLIEGQPRENVTLQHQQPDVVYLGIEMKRRVHWDGEGKLTVTKRRRNKFCPICRANFGCCHL